MTLTLYPDVTQGSDDWHDQRRGMVTASVVGQLVTPTLKIAANIHSRAITNRIVAERITGWTDPTYVSDDMLRGTEEELLARDLYSKKYAPVTTLGFMALTVSDGDTGLSFDIGFSPDGLVGADGIIEVKSRRQDKHLATILSDEVPAEFMAQIQTGLLVSGRKWCDFISYCGGMPMWTERVYPSDEWQSAILGAVAELEQAAVHMTATYRDAVEGLPTTERIIYEEMVI